MQGERNAYQPNTEAFELVLDDGFVAERLQYIEHDEEQTT